MADDKRRALDHFHITREVRPIEIVSVSVLIVGFLGVWYTNDNRIGNLEKAQERQEKVNSEIKTNLQQVSTDVAKVSGSVQRIEGFLTPRLRSGVEGRGG